MKIIVPSYKRAGGVLTHLYLTQAFIAVGEEEADLYREHHAEDRLMVMPAGVQGNIARVRNWIMDNAGDEQIIMLDDDLKYFGRSCGNGDQVRLTEQECMEMFEQGFILAEDVGAKLWGVNLQSDPKFYREYTPFSTQSPVLGPMTAHILKDNPLRYDVNLNLKEDYDFALQHLNKYHKVFRMNKYHYVVEHLTNAGGCVSYRTMERERQQNEMLLQKWGSAVVRYDLDKSINPVISSPFKGI